MEPVSMSSAIAGLVFIKDSLSELIAIRDQRKLSSAIDEINQRLSAEIATVLTLQERHATQLDQIQQMKAETARLEETLAQMAPYKLQKIGLGIFVYAPDNTSETGEPMHYACPNCMKRSKEVSILQPSPNGMLLRCPSCKIGLQIADGGLGIA
jgi:hypothetical protein